MIFETKKINIETLGEYLKEVRKSLNLELSEVASKTGIKEKNLQFLEEGRFEALPAEVYVLGFLKSLSGLYGIDFVLITEQYKKERAIESQLLKNKNRSAILKGKKFFNFFLTPKLLSLGLGLAFVLVTVGYIIWQVGSINRMPSLEIFEPQDQSVITDSYVNVRGKTSPGMSVSVNGQDIFVDADGNFKTQLGVSEGSKEIAVVSKNKLDKSVAKTIRVIVQPQANNTNQTVNFTIKLELLGDAQITFKIDDSDPQTVSFHSGDSKLLSAQKQILISTSNAGVTKVSLNDKTIGLMGRLGEVLTDIPFFPESDIINTPTPIK